MFTKDTIVNINVTVRASQNKVKDETISKVVTLGTLGIDPSQASTPPALDLDQIRSVSEDVSLTPMQRSEAIAKITAKYHEDYAAWKSQNQNQSVSDLVRSAVHRYLIETGDFSQEDTREDVRVLKPNDLQLSLDTTLKDPQGNPVPVFLVTAAATWGA